MDATRQGVRSSLSKLKGMFSNAFDKLIWSKSVTLQDLKSCVEASDCEVPKQLLNASNKEEFLDDLRLYCSIHNPTLLNEFSEHGEHLKDEEARRTLTTLSEECTKFQRGTKLKDIAGNFYESVCSPPGYKELELRLRETWHGKSMCDLEDVKKNLSQKLWLIKEIQLEGGSTVIITYMVPNSEGLKSTHLKECLHKNAVLQLTMGGKKIYKDDKMFIIDDEKKVHKRQEKATKTIKPMIGDSLVGASNGTKQGTSTGARGYSCEGTGMQESQTGTPSPVKDQLSSDVNYGEHSLQHSADEPSTMSKTATNRKRVNPEASTHLPPSKRSASIEGKSASSTNVPRVKSKLTKKKEDHAVVHPSMSQDQVLSKNNAPMETLSAQRSDLLPGRDRPGDKNQSTSRKRPHSFISSTPRPSKSPRLMCQDVQASKSPDMDTDAQPTTPIGSSQSHHTSASRESGIIDHTASGVRDASVSNTPTNSNCTSNKVAEQTPDSEVPPITSTSVQINNALQPTNMPTNLAETNTESDSMSGSDNESCESSTSTDDNDSDVDQTDSDGHTPIDKQTTNSSSTFPDLGYPSKKASDSRPGKRGGRKSNLTQSKLPLIVRRQTKDGDEKSTRVHKVLPRKKPRRSPRVKSKSGKKINVRKTRCAKDEKHLCPICSLPDCGECKNCLNKSRYNKACLMKPIEKCRKYSGQCTSSGTNVNDSTAGERADTARRSEHSSTSKEPQATEDQSESTSTPNKTRSSSHSSGNEDSSDNSESDAEDFHTLLDKALEETDVEILTAKCGVFGPPGSGKSHFKAIISGRERPKGRRKSTSIATDAEQIECFDIKEELVEMHRLKDGSRVRWYVTDSNKIASLVANTIYSRSKPTKLSASKRRKLSRTREKILDKMTKLIDRKLSRNPKIFKNMKLIYIVDTGGQSQFQEIMPVFVRSSSVHFLVHKLSETLEDCPKFDYEIEGVKYKVPEEHLVSNKVYLEQSLRTISSCKFAHGSERKPHFAVIGMFKDQCKDLDGKQKAVDACIRPYTESKKCIAFTQSRRTDKPVFAIDGSMNGWSSNGKVVDELHTQIEDFVSRCKTKIPIRWFLFLNTLKEEAKKNPFVTLENCCQLAQREDLMMDEEDVVQALERFDELNLVLYFNEILSEIVFILPSFLIDKVSAMIMQSFDSESESEAMTSHDRQKFRETGIFESNVMMRVESIKAGFNIHFTQDKFFNLLEKLCIIAKLPSGRFFLPSALALERDSIYSEVLKQAMTVEPLIISFADGYSPRGLFCASIACLANLPNWRIESDHLVLKRKRNLVEFAISCENNNTLLGKVAIIDRTSRIEVYCTCSHEHLCNIRCTIQESLMHASTQCLHYNPDSIGISVGFSCEINCGKEKPHGTKVVESAQGKAHHGQKMKCLKNLSKQAVSLNEKQVPWFSTSTSTSPNASADSATTSGQNTGNKPTIKLLMNEVAGQTTCQWQLIAIQLELDDLIEQIEEANENRDLCLHKVFTAWKKHSTPPFTWAEIINVLDSPTVREHDQADRLKKMFLT